MIRKYVLPVIALAGVLFAIYTVVTGNRQTPAAPPVAQPASAPFDSYVAGAGIVEASTENIAIGTHVPGVVQEVLARVGDTVTAGQPLFRVDDRELKAELAVRESAARTARAELERLKSMPRPEDVPPAEANVARAQASLDEAKNLLDMWDNVSSGVVSAEELTRRRSAVKVAEAELAAANAELAKLQAGSWAQDIQVARAQLAAAEAQVEATKTQIDRLTVRASVAGRVLQVNVRPGEYAAAPLSGAGSAEPLMLLGDVDTLHVRVDVDENDAWRIRADATATAFVRGNSSLKTKLAFVRIEPYVVPKRSLTGESTERVDTRVLQVLYRFDRGDLPIYVGQQMDVFIEAVPFGGTTTTRAAVATR